LYFEESIGIGVKVKVEVEIEKRAAGGSAGIDEKTGETCKDSAGNIKTKPTPAVGRDIGAAVSMLVVAIQQLADRLDQLQQGKG